MLDRFSGVTAALVTPFTADGGAVDETAFAALVAAQIEGGTDALLVGSVAGEGPTLSPRERERLVAIAVEGAAGRVPVIAATGSNATEASVAATRRAAELGADAALLVLPYYNKPGQEGVFRHFEAIARAVDLPLILEDAPQATGIALAPGTLARLARFPSIIGIVDGSPEPMRPASLAGGIDRPFLHLTSRDALAASFLSAGGHGCLSAVATIAPRACTDLRRACREGDVTGQRTLAARLAPLIAAIESESVPAAVKHALALTRPGFAPTLRLPMVPLGPVAGEAVRAALGPHGAWRA